MHWLNYFSKREERSEAFIQLTSGNKIKMIAKLTREVTNDMGGLILDNIRRPLWRSLDETVSGRAGTSVGREIQRPVIRSLASISNPLYNRIKIK